MPHRKWGRWNRAVPHRGGFTCWCSPTVLLQLRLCMQRAKAAGSSSSCCCVSRAICVAVTSWLACRAWELAHAALRTPQPEAHVKPRPETTPTCPACTSCSREAAYRCSPHCGLRATGPQRQPAAVPVGVAGTASAPRVCFRPWDREEKQHAQLSGGQLVRCRGVMLRLLWLDTGAVVWVLACEPSQVSWPDLTVPTVSVVPAPDSCRASTTPCAGRAAAHPRCHPA